MNTKNDVYVISLDAVDLNWLPISQKHRDGGAVPLWSKSNLDSRRNEYYEFVIKSDDTKEDQNEPVIENVTCHICDINVPKGYFNEHKNGFRHKFNRKVADTALKRHLLYVSKEDINEFNEKLPSKHFCTECSIVIDGEDETTHKQTTGHRNALFLERFLNEFLNFYTNDDNGIDDTRKAIKTEVVKESKNCEQGLVSDEPNITETVLTDIKKESVKTEDVKETKDDENSKVVSDLDFVSNEPNITETVLTNIKKESVKTEDVKETKDDENSKVVSDLDFVSNEPNITETVLTNIKKESVKTEDVKETKDDENSKVVSDLDFASNEPNNTETVMTNIKKESVKTEDVKETKDDENSKVVSDLDFVSNEPNITEAVLTNIKKESVKTEDVKEKKNDENSKVVSDSDFVSNEPNITETVLTNIKKESVKTEDVKETKDDENSKVVSDLDFVSNDPNITETVLTNIKKESVKTEDVKETKDDENSKVVSDLDFVSNEPNNTETLLTNIKKESVKTEDVKETKDDENSKVVSDLDFVSNEPNITETVLTNIKKESVKTEDVKETKDDENSKVVSDLDFVSNEPNNTETVLTNIKKESVKTEDVKETKDDENSKVAPGLDFVSNEPNITETVLTNIKKESVKTEDVKETKDDENSKIVSDLVEQNANSNPSRDLQEGEVMFQVGDGSKRNTFKVSNLYYEAIVEISATTEYCMICNHMYVQEYRSVHACSDSHHQKLHEKPLDGNCVRKINSSHHHCVLCNDYFTEYDLHVNSEEHLTNFRNKLVREGDKTAQDNDKCNNDGKCVKSKEYSDVLKSDENKSSIDTNKNTTPVNKDTRDSVAPNTSSSVPIQPTTFCDTCNIPISTEQFKIHKNTMKHTLNEMSDYHYLMKYLDEKKLFCRLCRDKVSNTKDDITEHCTGARHVKKYSKFLYSHSIIKRYYKKYYCKECKVYILHKNELLHIKSKEHQDKVRISKTGEIDGQCDDTTGPADGDATETVALVDTVTDGGGSGSATDNVQVNANNVTALNTVNQLNNNSVNENQVLAELLIELFKALAEWVTKIKEARERDTHHQENVITDVYNENTVEYCYICDVCKVKVPNNDYNIAEHNRGRFHKLKLETYVPRY